MSNEHAISIAVDRDKLFAHLQDSGNVDEAMSMLGHRIVTSILSEAKDWKDDVFLEIAGLSISSLDDKKVVTKEYLSAAEEVAKSLNRFVDVTDEDDIVLKLLDASHDLETYKNAARVSGVECKSTDFSKFGI